MPPILVVENEHPRQRLLGWTLQQEGLEVEVSDPISSLQRSDARVYVLNADLPIDERRALVETLHHHGGKIIDLLGTGDVESATGADVYVPVPHRVADIVRAIARLAAN